LMEMSRKIETKTNVYPKGTPAAHKGFSVATVDYTCKETSTREQRFGGPTNGSGFRHVSSDFVSAKSFDQEKLGTEGDAGIYRDHNLLKIMTRGDFFCWKSIA